MPGLLPDVDPDGLLEYSVVYTDRSLNHLSKRFAKVMQDLSAGLKEVYGAAAAVGMSGLTAAILLIYLYRYMTSAGEKYVTISSRGYRPAASCATHLPPRCR